MAIGSVILKNLLPKMRYGDIAPLGDTSSSGRFGYRPPPPQPPPTGIFFTENFDAQADYISAQFKANGAMPANVYAMRIADDLWTPSNGHPDREECLIIDNTRTYNGTGKSVKFHRMSNSNPTNNTAMWNSEDIMLWYFPDGMLQVYVEYMVRFDDNWTFGVDTGASKLFRIFSWNGQGNIFQFFEGGNSGPLFVWDKEETALYGTRNPLSMRGGPWGSNYYMSGSDFGNVTPNSNFTNSLINQGLNGTTPQLPDKLNGGFIPNSGIASHAQVFGPAGTWTKMAFFVKMNSDPNTADGELKMWIDNKQIVNGSGIHWVKPPASGAAFIPKWNCIAFGGNDYFHAYPTEDRRSEWYAIDNIVMRHDIPGGLS